MPRVGLEERLRARGIRPGPVYTVVQICVVLAAMGIGVAMLAVFGH